MVPYYRIKHNNKDYVGENRANAIQMFFDLSKTCVKNNIDHFLSVGNALDNGLEIMNMSVPGLTLVKVTSMDKTIH